jgi:rhodanese-related sulfurtransferase
MSDVAIIGGGPTGLNAAIYTARADKRTLVFDDGSGTTRDVDTMENVYGFPDGVTGPELVDLGREHAQKYGAEIVEEEVVRIEPDGERYRVETTVDEYVVDGVVIATGADYERPAIAHRDTVFDIRDYDLAYAPPYSAAKDPVNMLGMIGANVVEGIADVVHLDEFLERKDEATVIDTRPPEMREAQGRIDGDENVPLGELREWAADANPDGEVFTYCKIGKSSYMATRVLAEYGITARSLTGGYYRYDYATDGDERVESVPSE